MKKPRKQNLTCIDLFCGCGGLSKGFDLAGYKVLGGIDFNSPAVKTYALNFPGAKAICCDLLEMGEDQIKKEFPVSHVDVIIGGPPCQGFSSANRYASDEIKDPRNRLFFQFVKFVDLFSPEAIVIENVRGILTKDNGYAKRRIEEIFRKRGYKVVNRILNATDFGVPQNRLRNFFVMLKSVKFDFNTLQEVEHCPTVQEAIGELYDHDDTSVQPVRVSIPPTTDYQRYLRSPDSTMLNHDVRYPAQKVQDRIAYVPQGGNWQDVPAEMWPTERDNRHSSAYKRLKEDEQSVTIDTGNNHSNYFHPLYNRLPTVREAARLQSFPDAFTFTGNRSEQYRQVGNAVPPLLSKAIADAIRKVL